jgi:hypothetical protein
MAKMNISDFWIAFLGGLASGIVLIILTAFMRRLLRKQPQDKQEPRKGIKELSPLIILGSGFILTLLALLFYDKIGIMSYAIILPGVMLLIIGAISFFME